MRPRIALLVAAVAAAASLAAEPTRGQDALQVPGERASTPKSGPTATLRLDAARDGVLRLRLPEVSAEEVERVRAANRESGRKGPRAVQRRVVVGIERPAPRVLASAADMEWIEVEGGHAAQVAITSPGAGSMRIAIDLAGVPLDVEMVVRGNAQPTRLEGPVRVGSMPDRTTPAWTALTEGETQTVEFFVPAAHDPASLSLRIVEAAHVFTTPSSRLTKRLEDIGRAESCNVDIACSSLTSTPGFRDVVSSVAQMVFNEGGFTVLCTGTLLADADLSTQTPWLYSANHCFENDAPPFKTVAQMQAVANTLSTLWFFEASGCRTGNPVAN